MGYKKSLGYDISIDSHSSKINNARIIHRFAQADELGVAASNKMTIPMIHAYFNELDSIFINVGHVLLENLDDKKCVWLVKLWKGYRRLYRKTLVHPTPRNALGLLEYAKKLNYALVSGLQNFQFFFRMGQRGKKGLKYIDELYGGLVEDDEER